MFLLKVLQMSLVSLESSTDVILSLTMMRILKFSLGCFMLGVLAVPGDACHRS